MLKPKGYAFLTDRESGKVIKEADTYTCGHCHRVVHVKPFCDPADLGGMCKVCCGLVCPTCNYKMSLGKPCVPFVERVARLDTRMERGLPYYDPLHRDD